MQKDGKKDRAAVDKVFFLRILRILRVLVPRVFCMEVRVDSNQQPPALTALFI